jgi:hypothetical protein
VKVFVVGEGIRGTIRHMRMAAAAAGTDSQTQFEEQDRASQIAARLIRNGHAHRAMRVKFPARFFNRLVPTTTGKPDRMIFSTRTFDARQSPAAIEVAFGDTADQLEISCILNHRLRRRWVGSRIACAAHVAESCNVQHNDASIGFITSLQRFTAFSSLTICATITLMHCIIH